MTYSPWAHLAAQPDLRLEFAVLDDDLGCYDPDTHTIFLDPRQSRVEMRSTLAHELAHAEHKQDEINVAEIGPDGDRIARRRERAADERAARRLIPLGVLIDALRWTQDEYEVAEACWVDVATARARIGSLTPAEKATIEARLRDLEEWGAA